MLERLLKMKNVAEGKPGGLYERILRLAGHIEFGAHLFSATL